MKNLLLLLFVPFVCLGQEDIERYKVYNTANIYTSLLLDSATGKIWQLQIGLTDVDQLKSVQVTGNSQVHWQTLPNNIKMI